MVLAWLSFGLEDNSPLLWELWSPYWWITVHWGKDKGNPTERLMLEESRESRALRSLRLHAATHPCRCGQGGERTLKWKGEFLFRSGPATMDGHGCLPWFLEPRFLCKPRKLDLIKWLSSHAQQKVNRQQLSKTPVIFPQSVLNSSPLFSSPGI